MTAAAGLERLAEDLRRACSEVDDRDAVALALASTASGMALFGAGLGDDWWSGMAGHERPTPIIAETVRHLLPEHLRPALEFELRPAADRAANRIGAAFVSVGGQRAVAAADLNGPTDVLGGLYSHLRSSSGRSARGAFYTPMSVARLMAAIDLPEPGAVVTDPCCGSGALLLAAVRELRNAGRDPREVRFVGNDLDPIAAALAHLNLTFAGVTPTITVGDALAQAG